LTAWTVSDSGLLYPLPVLCRTLSFSRLVAFTGKHIQVMPVAAFQIAIVAERKPQKIQRLSALGHLNDVRLVPVQLQAQLPFQFVPDPVSASAVKKYCYNKVTLIMNGYT
jgi:hypothetical protein